VVDPQVSRSLREAVAGTVASLGSWGVVSMHWLPGTDGQPVIWLTTSTEAERAALEAAPWLTGQVTMLLIRAQAPYETWKRLRILVESQEAQRLLIEEIS
jgi:hypothetical protein